MSTDLSIILYAPADAIIEHPYLLEKISSMHDLQGIIIRSASKEATEIVQKHGIKAYWLAPGLWGHIIPVGSSPAIFPELSAHVQKEYPAYERQFQMVCANTPDLAEQNAMSYASTVRELGANGVFGTHIRYHHPANIEHLWGCLCKHCQTKAIEKQLDFDLIPLFFEKLANKLQNLPIDQWTSVSPIPDMHPLVDWWSAVTEMEFPQHWFNWKNDIISSYILQLERSFHDLQPDAFFATNSFEPFLGNLVGNAVETQEASAWYAPLLGYWTHHVQQSLENIAAWHTDLSGQPVTTQLMSAIMQIDGSVKEAIPQQIRLGSILSDKIGHDYFPVFNGAAANQYGGTSEQFPLKQALKLASGLNAKGSIIQGISQLLDDPSLDFWY